MINYGKDSTQNANLLNNKRTRAYGSMVQHANEKAIEHLKSKPYALIYQEKMEKLSVGKDTEKFRC